jgi:hypothetical protein
MALNCISDLEGSRRIKTQLTYAQQKSQTPWTLGCFEPKDPLQMRMRLACGLDYGLPLNDAPIANM